MNQLLTSSPRPKPTKLQQFRALMTGSNFTSAETPSPAALLAELSPWQNGGGPTDIHRECVTLGDYEGWDLKATVYTPETQLSGLTQILFLHGGAWVLGNPASHDKLTRQIAAMGYEVWSLDYPRAPRWPFPAALNTVIHTVDELIDREPQQIIVAGDSAGAGLAASAALTRPNAVAALALMYPVLDYRDGFGFFSRFFSHLETSSADPYLDSLDETLDPDDSRINPLAHASDLPPTWVTFGEHDPLAGQSESLGSVLATTNTVFEFFPAAGSGHAFMQDPDDDNVAAALASLREFLHQRPIRATHDFLRTRG